MRVVILRSARSIFTRVGRQYREQCRGEDDGGVGEFGTLKLRRSVLRNTVGQEEDTGTSHTRTGYKFHHVLLTTFFNRDAIYVVNPIPVSSKLFLETDAEPGVDSTPEKSSQAASTRVQPSTLPS